MQDEIGLPLDDIHILGNVPQCTLHELVFHLVNLLWTKSASAYDVSDSNVAGRRGDLMDLADRDGIDR